MADIGAFDKDLSKLVSYITFDGHLAQDLKCFYLSSKNEDALLDFKDIVYRKFGIEGRFEDGNGYCPVRKYRYLVETHVDFLKKLVPLKATKLLSRFWFLNG